jgi:hypothetical protein
MPVFLDQDRDIHPIGVIEVHAEWHPNLFDHILARQDRYVIE